MGGFLKEGQWFTDKEWKTNHEGEFVRQQSHFRNAVTSKPGARFAPEAGRYHLYISHACPWAHRTAIARSLLGLGEAIGLSVVDPLMLDDGWTFDTPEPIGGARFLRDVYTAADPKFTGRVTVPVLWDKKEGTIVNNESREILRMFTTVFAPLATHDMDLAPEGLRKEIDRILDDIYQPINNGVYRCGFASKQAAYESAYDTLFEALEKWDAHLGKQKFLCGDAPTEADICLFTTLYRFDPVYYVHFKCNGFLIAQRPNLSRFRSDMLALPGLRETCHLDHIKQHYYGSHPALNPKGIVPKGPGRLE